MDGWMDGWMDGKVYAKFIIYSLLSLFSHKKKLTVFRRVNRNVDFYYI